MTTGFAAMLLGVFGVPALLLWAGHRLRRRSREWRGAFWGGIAGHLVALVIGSIAAMTPAATWTDTDTLRGAAGYWSFVVLPLAGAVAGSLRARASRGRAPER